MGALHRFEQRLEHMVTGAFARAFRSVVQPMEIAAALQREVDNSAQILSRDRRLAPNDFTIDLSGVDYDRLSTYGQSLVSELAALMHEYAAEQHYVFAGPLQLNFHRADDLTTGRFRVRSAAAAAVTPAPAAGPVQGRREAGPTPVALEIAGVRHPVDAPGVVIGRGSNAGLRIDDPGVSRRHAEIRVQSGRDDMALSVVDLGSTNGTLVDGQRVQHSPLHDGAVVQVGSTKIVIRVSDQTPRRPLEPGVYRPNPYPPPYQPPQDVAQQPPGDGPSQRPWGA